MEGPRYYIEQGYTQVIIYWLTSDETVHNTLRGESAEMIEQYVRQGYAPQGLYDDIKGRTHSSLKTVDWKWVEYKLNK